MQREIKVAMSHIELDLETLYLQRDEVRPMQLRLLM